MTYKESLHFLYNSLPVFQHIGATAYKPGLDNTYALASFFGNPQNDLKFIHIAGTNGKGSTSHMLASIFQEMGWKTGLFTSPHLKDFRERIKVNGKTISKKFVFDFVRQSKPIVKKIQPSFFELTFVMALSYFKERKTDIVILETGMGGRLDSSNIVLPDLCVITNISKDHVQFLGNTLEKIAVEKAGIIKPGIPVVIGQAKGRVKNVFTKTARQNDAQIAFAERVKINQGITCELKGSYQPKNIRTVLKSVEVLNQNGYSIPFTMVKRGLAKVITNTGLMGRWQTIAKNPLIIADIGHNEAGINEVVKNLKQTHYDNLHIVLGVVNDKDVRSMLKVLPKKATYYFTNAKIARALPAKELKERAQEFKLSGQAFSSVKVALNAAKQNANKSDLIFVGGSAFIVAEVV